MRNGSTATWQRRLQTAQRAGNLTVADLARWFDRPHATVRTWVCDGREPGGGPLDIQHAQALLGLLETLIARKKGFPLPQKGRRQKLLEIRAAVLPAARDLA